MRSIINLKSNYEKIKSLSYIYPYNSSIFTIAVGNTEFHKKRRGDIKGYVPLTNIWKDSIQIDHSPSSYEIDSVKVNAYETFIKDCIHSKVKLYIICSPYFIKSNKIDYSVRIGQDIAKRNNIEFFDYSTDSFFINNRKIFADIEHLNNPGAIIFSNMLIDKISKMNQK